MSALTVLLCYCGAADAYGPLRCKGKIVDAGATMAEVLSLCGEPKERVAIDVPIRARALRGSRLIGVTTTEQWIYNRGWGRFPAVVVFDGGTVRRIDYLPRRSGKE